MRSGRPCEAPEGLARRVGWLCATTSAVEPDAGKGPPEQDARAVETGSDQPGPDPAAVQQNPSELGPVGSAAATELGDRDSRRGWIAVIVVALLVAAATGVGAAAGLDAAIHTHETATVRFSPNTSVFRPMKDVKAVLARVLPSVVTIQAFGPGCGPGALSGATELEEGTGMILTRAGEILTNNHVIAEASQIKVTLYGQTRTYPATLLGTDPGDDVALLQLNGPGSLRAVSLGTSPRPRVGDEVLAIGNALALSQTKPSVTEGIISAEDRSIKAGGGQCAGTESLTGLLQTQAAINSGNSGGPLVNTSGQVIGMSTAAATTTTGNAPTQNIGFAIPVASIKALLPGLRRGGTAGRPKAFLGVEVVSVTAANRSAYGLYPTQGALVVGLFPGAPAAQAGIRVGDVITNFQGRAISTDVALTVATRGVHPGNRVTLRLYRGPKLLTISLVLGSKPAPQAGAG